LTRILRASAPHPDLHSFPTRRSSDLQNRASGWAVALRQSSPRIAAIASSVSPEGCQRRRKRLRLPTVSLLASVASTEESVSVAPEFREKVLPISDFCNLNGRGGLPL